MKVEILNRELTPEQESAIADFLVTHKKNTVFQSAAIYTLYYSLKNYTPYYFLIYTDANELAGIMLAAVIREGNSLVSQMFSRCVIQGGPLVKDDNPEYLDPLLKALNTHIGLKTLLIQIRNYNVWDQQSIEVFARHGYIFHDHLDLIIKNISITETFNGISAARRRQIKKGQLSGAIVKPASNLDEVRELYRILQSLYRDKVRKPFPGWSFFEQFYRQLVPAGNGVILLVYFNEKIIGGIVSPVTPGKMMYELYICGLDKEFPAQYPSVLATWAALEWAASNNIPAFDFLGLGKPGVPYGVRDFKLRFGGEQVNFGRFGRRNYHLVYSIAEMGYNVLRRLRRV